MTTHLTEPSEAWVATRRRNISVSVGAKIHITSPVSVSKRWVIMVFCLYAYLEISTKLVRFYCLENLEWCTFGFYRRCKWFLSLPSSSVGSFIYMEILYIIICRGWQDINLGNGYILFQNWFKNKFQWLWRATGIHANLWHWKLSMNLYITK